MSRRRGAEHRADVGSRCGGGRRRRSRPHADGERGKVRGRRYRGPFCGGAGHGPLRAGQQRRRRLRRREAAGTGGLGGARRADRRSGAAEGRCGRRCPRLAGRCDAGRSCGARRRWSCGRCAVRRRPHAAGRGTGSRCHRGPAAITFASGRGRSAFGSARRHGRGSRRCRAGAADRHVPSSQGRPPALAGAGLAGRTGGR